MSEDFTAVEPLLLRMTGVPRHRLPATGDPASPGLPAALADPVLREAVEVASSSLGEALDRLAAGADPGPRRRRSLAASTTRYALRLATRPTPFGLFAGVAPARTGPRTRFAVTGPGSKAARPDGQWLRDRVRDWCAGPEVRRRTDVVWNNLVSSADGRFQLGEGGAEVSVRRNALVTWVHERAAAPLPYRLLLQEATAAFPQATEARIDDVLASLLTHGLLLASLSPQRTDATALDTLEAALTPLPGARRELHAVRRALDTYGRTAPGEGRAQWRALTRRMRTREAQPSPPVQVDLRMAVEAELPPQVTAEAERYAAAMWAISEEWLTHRHMRDYQLRFLERYGTATAVRLADLTDPHRGLGFPEGYDAPLDRQAPTAPPDGEASARRRALVAELTQEALVGRDRELRLTSQTVERLAAGHRHPDLPAPRSLELCFQLLAGSAAALDAGDFRLLASPHAAAWLAGATAGRFASTTGTEEELARLVRAGVEPGDLPAQVTFRPRSGRALNTSQVPLLVPHEIPVGAFPERRGAEVVDWRGLLVSLGPAGFRLTCPDSGREVVPFVPHLVALDHEAPRVVRLLVDMVFGRGRTWTGWDWRGLEVLPVLPRVTFGRVTVSPLRWLPDRHLSGAAAGDAGDGAWEAAVHGWRERYRVPDRVQVVRGDRVYGIDLTDPWHRCLLREEVRGGRPALFEDPAADGDGLGWAAGHRTEIVVPLLRRDLARRLTEPAAGPAPAAPGAPAVRADRPAPRRLPVADPGSGFALPGEGWLYAKVYAAPETHDALLATRLPALLDEVADHLTGWHFVRYRDPEPHLRVRLAGEPGALRGTVLPRLTAWGRALRTEGALRTLTLDTYEPETARYGGPAALPHAEAVFHLDSRSATEQLARRRHGGPRLPPAVWAVLNHVALLDALGDRDWPAWVCGAYRRRPDLLAPEDRAVARELVVPGSAARLLGERLDAPRLADLWTRDPAPRRYGRLFLPAGPGTAGDGSEPGGAARTGTPCDGAARDEVFRSLLHMQHNRLLGTDRQAEDRSCALLRAVAQDVAGRRRHLSAPASQAAGTARGRER
ncbi:lantibiotic dehydratase [Streptomyces sp. NPDC059740]|uniref:lantibiotic dehydratase n=1 Tax=Streptomyces sp. NPDC059740 TaxID=3346926 RepID=UPI0036597185